MKSRRLVVHVAEGDFRVLEELAGKVPGCRSPQAVARLAIRMLIHLRQVHQTQGPDSVLPVLASCLPLSDSDVLRALQMAPEPVAF